MQSRWLTGSVVVCSVLASVFVACGSEPGGTTSANATAAGDPPDATVVAAPVKSGRRASRAHGVPAGVKPFRPQLAAPATAPSPVLDVVHDDPPLHDDALPVVTADSPDRADPRATTTRFHDEATPQCHAPKLAYFDGPIIQSPVVVPVFWNSTVNAQVQASMSQFYADAMASTYWQWLWEYDSLGLTGGSGQVIVPGIALPGVVIIPTLCPAGSGTNCRITDTQLQAELNRQIGLGILPEPVLDCTGNVETVYMVSFPPNVSLTGPDGAGSSCANGGFCAYHNTGTVGATATPLIYGALMDEFSGGCAMGCGTNATPLENVTDTASHELVEAVTDPDIGLDTGAGYQKPAGWGDNNDECGEIADICDDDSKGDTITVGGRTWTVQEVWSNAQTKCTSTGPAKTCPTADNCGTVTNGCATPIACGTCTLPDTCGGGTPTNANVCGCTTLTACPVGQSCGTIANGCGGTLSCGTCTSPQTCGGGTPSVPNTCGCTPKTTCAAGSNCGTEPDGCGGTVICGACVLPDTCTANVCGCTPTTTACPAGENCGPVPNGCGGTVNCGTCAAPQTCGGGILGAVNVCGCTPLLVCPVGDACGTIPDGCGGNVSCGTCTASQTCNATNQCVTLVVDAGHDSGGTHDASSSDGATAHEGGASDAASDSALDAKTSHDATADAHVTNDGSTKHDGSLTHDGAVLPDTGAADAHAGHDAGNVHDAQARADAKIATHDGGSLGSADATTDALADGGEGEVGQGGGCSCRTAPAHETSRTSALLVLIPLAFIGRRRQKRKGAATL